MKCPSLSASQTHLNHSYTDVHWVFLYTVYILYVVYSLNSGYRGENNFMCVWLASDRCLIMWQHTQTAGWLQQILSVSPLVFFQSPSAEFRLTLRAMAARVPVWRDCTNATVPTPRVIPRATLPRQPLHSRIMEEPFPWLDLQSAALAVVENFSARRATLIWPRGGLVAGFLTSCGLPGVKMCLNLTLAPWKLARTRDRGPVYRGTDERADNCSAMPEITTNRLVQQFHSNQSQPPRR